MQRYKQLVGRFLFEDSGQDLVEYALLTALVGVSGIAVFFTMRNNMGDRYTAWGADIQANWAPNPPGS